MSKASGGVVVTQARKGLDRVEIKLLSFDDLLESEIEANRSLVNDVPLRSGAEKSLQTWLKIRDFPRGDLLRLAYEFGRIARVNIHSKHPHPLGGIGDPTRLTHAPPAEGAQGGHIQQGFEVGGPRIAGDL